jgi:hypothetical protein
MIFGIYPGGMSGTESGMTTGPANDPEKIHAALDRLHGTAPVFIVRAYAGYKGKGQPTTIVPENPEQYIKANRPLDLVLCYQSDETDLDGWKDFISDHIKKYHRHIRYLQITEEANVNLPGLDGYFSNSRRALVEGIVFAKQIIKAAGLSAETGFNATPDFNPDRQFWKEIRSLAAPEFHASLDYVGLDCFPDVFRALPRLNGELIAYEPLKQVITFFRNDILEAGIRADIPLHITENGWPTNLLRTEAEQAIALNAIIRAIHSMRYEFNIRVYEMFDLRDADSSVEDIFYRFGIMRSDYTPKPAFENYCSLISELS